jgi:hypothetical protein
MSNSETDHASSIASQSASADDTDTNDNEMERKTERTGGIASQTAESDVDAIAEAVAEKLQHDDSADDIEDQRPEWVFNQFKQHWKADDKAHSSLQPYESAWRQFCEWMDEQGHIYLTDLTPRFPGRHDGWIVAHDEYDKTKLSRSMHLSRVKTVVRHAQSRGWIDPSDVPDDETWDEVKPEVDDGEKIRSNPLPPERGEQITKWVRANRFGSRAHVLWLLLFEGVIEQFAYQRAG